MLSDNSDRFDQSLLQENQTEFPEEREIGLLQSDAYKPGYWQAKLAYAKFLMKPWSGFKQVQNLENHIKTFLNEVADSKPDYVAEAELLIETHFYNGKQDRIKINELSNDIETEKRNLSKTFQRKIHLSLDYRYKFISFTYEDDKIKNKEHKTRGDEEKHIEFNTIISTAILEFENLLKEREITDALLAEIYFRLIELYIERANLKGYESDLIRAKHYCKLLTSDRNLQDMDKAKRAALIYNEINRPVLDFKKHMKGAFEAGKKGNEVLFKYLGLIIGNVLDLSTFCIFKLIGDQNKSGASYFFLHSGFARGCRYLGGLFGKHIIGNLIGGPIGAVLGLISYPIMHSYFENNLEDKKGLVAKVRGINAPAPSGASLSTAANNNVSIPPSSSAVIQKKIFDRKPRVPKIFHSDTVLDMEIPVASEASLVKSSPYNDNAPYGSVFGIEVGAKNQNSLWTNKVEGILLKRHKNTTTSINNPNNLDINEYAKYLNIK